MSSIPWLSPEVNLSYEVAIHILYTKQTTLFHLMFILVVILPLFVFPQITISLHLSIKPLSPSEPSIILYYGYFHVFPPERENREQFCSTWWQQNGCPPQGHSLMTCHFPRWRRCPSYFLHWLSFQLCETEGQPCMSSPPQDLLNGLRTGRTVEQGQPVNRAEYVLYRSRF